MFFIYFLFVLYGNNGVTAARTDKIQNGLETRGAETFWRVQWAPIDADNGRL
jgi:hypothetical protein